MLAIPPRRRRPKPAITEEALLAATERDPEGSPQIGAGHRKVGARLRVMWQKALLSPVRDRRGDKDSHAQGDAFGEGSGLHRRAVWP